MNPSSHEEHKRHAFDSFCKKVLKNEVRNYYVEANRQRERETLFSEMSAQEMELLYMLDEYPSEQSVFRVLEYDVAVKSELLAEALTVLPVQKRDIILLHHFLDMTDREIGGLLNMARQTVQYQRTSSLQQIKKFMEGKANDKTDA